MICSPFGPQWDHFQGSERLWPCPQLALVCDFSVSDCVDLQMVWQILRTSNTSLAWLHFSFSHMHHLSSGVVVLVNHNYHPQFL